MTKLHAGGLSIAVIVATLSPIGENWSPHSKDGFPLSHYPAFSAKRSDSVQVTYLVGLDSAGGRHLVSHRQVGPGGLDQVWRQIATIARRGDPDALCRRVAAKLAAWDATYLRQVSEVRVVTGWYRLSDYLGGATVPFAEREHASCEVRRRVP